MRELIYYVAISLDGFIASPGGSGDFCLFEGDHAAELTGRFPETVPTTWREAAGVTKTGNKRFDTVLMGRATYAAGVADSNPNPYAHLRQYVFSHGLTRAADPAVRIVATSALDKVRELKRQPGKDIWLSGGGRLANALQPEIDEMVVKINPVTIGSGIPLFAGDFQPVRYQITDSQVFGSGVAAMTYRKR